MPNLYNYQDFKPNDESFLTADNLESFTSERSSSEVLEEEKMVRRETIENLRAIRKIIMMVEVKGIECKIGVFDRTVSNLKEVL